MPNQIFRVDTLTSTPFHGTPVAVCLLEGPRERPWMRDLSLDLAASETAFLLPRSPNRFDLRVMAGSTEVELSALASLAAAHVLYEYSLADKRHPIAFFTRTGPVPATMEEGNALALNFPQMVMEECPEPPEVILQAVDPAPEFVGRRENDYFVQVSNEARLREIRPDFAFLRAAKVKGLLVTSAATISTANDFVAQTFAIGGHEEDTLASYGHCLLAPFWFLRLGKSKMTGLRRSRVIAHPRSPSSMTLEVDGDRLRLLGEAVTIFRGELAV